MSALYHIGAKARQRLARLTTLFAVTVAVSATNTVLAGEWRASGEISGEVRLFPEEPGFVGQESTTLSPSLSFDPELVYESDGGNDRFTLQPYVRWDAHDGNRTHFDLRTASWLHQSDDWDLVVGIDSVFWGVTESVHLVDIVNQTDFVEDLDGEDKLGQPMINLNLIGDRGTFGLFVLPGFRERTFADGNDRFRGPLPIDVDNPVYDPGRGNKHIDYAARWTQSAGGWDLGISHFFGTSREPRLLLQVTPDGAVLAPRYDVIHQTGLDLQYTGGAWLWKLEAMTRSGHGKRFVATVAGFEYTLFGVRGSGADLGLLAEYQYDGRRQDDAPLTIADNDIFAGARLALNDEQSTALLAGMTRDLSSRAMFFFFEAERRIGSDWMIELEGRVFANVPASDIAAYFRDDSVVTLRLARFF